MTSWQNYKIKTELQKTELQKGSAVGLPFDSFPVSLKYQRPRRDSKKHLRWRAMT